MSFSDKVEGKKDELTGKAKQSAGDLTDNSDAKADGQAQESQGKLHQGAEQAKDAVKNAGDGLTGR